MPRPKRCRMICGYPEFWSFAPEEEGMSPQEDVVLTLDEFETIRQIDYGKLTQEQCAAQMNVSRTTVTAIYDKARYKLADALINGRRIVISGGDVRLHPEAVSISEKLSEKGEQTMRIAVTYENGEVFQHFGHTQQFKLYDVENGEIVNEEILSSGEHGHGALAGLLNTAKADILICGGIGGGARTALAEAGIELYPGVKGSADEAAKALVAGSLNYDPDTQCSHHGEGHEHHGGQGCGHDHHGGQGCGHGSCHK